MPRPGHASRWLLLLAGVLVTWSLSIARYGGPDEPGHVLRAAAAGSGAVLGDTVDGLVSGFRAVTVPAPLATGDPRCFRHDRRVASTCAHAEAGATGVRRVASSAGTNPPWYYLAVGLLVRLLGDRSVVISYRLAAAGLVAAALAFALVRREAGSRWVVLVALTPAAWFLGGVVNPNSLEIALAVLAWVGVGRLGESGTASRTDLAWVAWPAAAAILIRPIAVVEVATMLAVVALLKPVAPDARMSRARLCRRLLAPPAAAVVASFGWSMWSAVAVSDERSASADGLVARLVQAGRGSIETVRELAGSMGWAEFSAPWPTQLLWWCAVFAAGVAAWRRGGALRRSWFLVAASVLLVPIAFEFVLAGRIGFIWQGRYSIPSAVGLVLIVPWRIRRMAWLGAAVVISEVGALWATLRRYTVGTNGSWLLHDQRWQPVLPPLVLIVANAVLLTALVLSVGAFGDAVSWRLRRPCGARR